MNDITISAEWIKYGGLAMSAACLLAVVVRNWSGISGLFSKIPLPGGEGFLPSSEPEDRRISMMRKWDSLKLDLVAVNADPEKIEAIDNIVWPEIRKAKVAE